MARVRYLPTADGSKDTRSMQPMPVVRVRVQIDQPDVLRLTDDSSAPSFAKRNASGSAKP